MKVFLGLTAVTLLVLACSVNADGDVYSVGFGIHDETGPSSGAIMMGYAVISQEARGIHLRQHARAVVVVDKDGNRVVYVNNDFGMTMQAVYLEVMQKLKEKFGGLYDYNNVVISSTHTHSGSGGMSHFMLYDFSTRGFCQETFDAYVNGIVGAIERAHNNIKPNIRMLYATGELENASANRSPTSYLKNPEEERKQYQHDTDKEMTVIKFVDEADKPVGMLSWFAVHGVSMKNTNHYISSDNKGYAATLFEGAMNDGALPGKGDFVAIFGQSNEGDSTPNTEGQFCGVPYQLPRGPSCDIETSTCDGKNENCHSWGPGKDEFESTKIIGELQFKKAMELFKAAATPISGPVGGIQTFVDFPNVKVSAEYTSTGKEGKTCSPAMGFSFAAGTIDGPGEFDFTQGDTKGNPMWKMIRSVLRRPTAEQKACQEPKPILLDVGEFSTALGVWAPKILPLQIARIGNFIIPAVPTEMTTMSGRRFRKALLDAFRKAGGGDDNTRVVIAGLSNTYAGYTTTYEEYLNQRYEGASTMYGPHQLAAWTQEYSKLAVLLAQGKKADPGPSPPDLKAPHSFITPHIVDTAPRGKNYGDVIKQPAGSAKAGDTVSVEFVGGDPRNNMRTESSYLAVERKDGDAWSVVHSDASWETRIMCNKNLWQETMCTIDWEIPSTVQPGTYRIRYFGANKSLIHGVKDFEGSSNEFEVGGATSLADMESII